MGVDSILNADRQAGIPQEDRANKLAFVENEAGIIPIRLLRQDFIALLRCNLTNAQEVNPQHFQPGRGRILIKDLFMVNCVVTRDGAFLFGRDPQTIQPAVELSIIAGSVNLWV